MSGFLDEDLRVALEALNRRHATLDRLSEAEERTRALFDTARQEYELVMHQADLASAHRNSHIQNATKVYSVALRAYRDALQELNRFVLQGGFSPRGAEKTASLIDILTATIAATQADMGNIQLLDDEGNLRIAAQVGFQRPFIEFFDCVHTGEAACGAALKGAQRVIVPDVETSPIFSDEARSVLLEAGVRAVQSTPIWDRSYVIIGMISTHYRAPFHPSRRDLMTLDAMADWLGISR